MVRCIGNMTTGIYAFVMRNVSVARLTSRVTRNAFSDSCPRCSSLLRKCVVSLVNELCSMYYAGDGLQIVNTFSRLAITGNNKAFVFGVRRYQETFSVVVNDIVGIRKMKCNTFLISSTFILFYISNFCHKTTSNGFCFPILSTFTFP